MPVRSIPRNYRSLTGKVINTRNQVAVTFESALERDFYLILDFDSAVAKFEEQPIHIVYEYPAGISRTYTPDVLVHYGFDPTLSRTPPPMLYEVKYRDDLRANWGEYKPKFKAARRYARRQGWGFRLVTECEIRTPYLKNAQFLREYRLRCLDSDDGGRLLAALAEWGETDAEALLARLSPTREARIRLLPVLWHLVAVGHIGADLTVPLTMCSRLWSLAPIRVDGDG